MNKEITSIPPFPAARIFAVLYFIIGLLVVPFVALPLLLRGQEGSAAVGLGVAIAFPVLYAVVGFVGVALGCWLYNVVAARIGGVQLRLGDLA